MFGIVRVYACVRVRALSMALLFLHGKQPHRATCFRMYYPHSCTVKWCLYFNYDLYIYIVV